MTRASSFVTLLLGAALLGGLALWSVGFLAYVDALAASREPLIDEALAPADAIVVLTGGSERLTAGVELLKAGKGKKLLISGVYPGLTASHILAKSALAPALRECCVALGHAADNTIGNAEETKAWLQGEGFSSVLLVTAHYHMPRSLLLFHKLLPGVAVQPFPVSPESVRLDAWWRRAGTASLLVTEYNKYLWALIRVWGDQL